MNIWEHLTASPEALDADGWADHIAGELDEHGALVANSQDITLVIALTLSAIRITSGPDDRGVTLWQVVSGGTERWRLLAQLAPNWHGSTASLWAATGLLRE